MSQSIQFILSIRCLTFLNLDKFQRFKPKTSQFFSKAKSARCEPTNHVIPVIKILSNF